MASLPVMTTRLSIGCSTVALRIDETGSATASFEALRRDRFAIAHLLKLCLVLSAAGK